MLYCCSLHGKSRLTSGTLLTRHSASVLKVGVLCELREAYKTRLANSVTIRILAQNNFMLLLKHFITEVLEYKAGRIKFVCVAMCSLVMSLCSRDLHVTSLNKNYYNTLNSSRLTVV